MSAVACELEQARRQRGADPGRELQCNVRERRRIPGACRVVASLEQLEAGALCHASPQSNPDAVRRRHIARDIRTSCTVEPERRMSCADRCRVRLQPAETWCGTPEAITPVMAAVLALIMLPIIAAIGSLLGILHTDGTFVAASVGFVIFALAAGVLAGAFRIVRDAEGEEAEPAKRMRVVESVPQSVRATSQVTRRARGPVREYVIRP
jgi:hypothetical protein